MYLVWCNAAESAYNNFSVLKLLHWEYTSNGIVTIFTLIGMLIYYLKIHTTDNNLVLLLTGYGVYQCISETKTLVPKRVDGFKVSLKFSKYACRNTGEDVVVWIVNAFTGAVRYLLFFS